MLTVVYAEYRNLADYANFRYADCHILSDVHAECHGATMLVTNVASTIKLFTVVIYFEGKKCLSLIFA
jgi:hypothetical protein